MKRFVSTSLSGAQGTIALNARVILPPDLSDSERSIWRHFCETDPLLANPFYSIFFAEALAECGVDVRVCVLTREDRPVGFFPFQFANRVARWFGAAERAGGEMSDYCGLIAEPGLRIDGGRQLITFCGLSSFIFSHLDKAQHRHGLSGERPEVGLIAQMASGGRFHWQEICDRDKAFARDTRRRLRRLEETLGPLRFVFKEQDPHMGIDQLIANKRAQYARTGKADALEEPWKAKLLHRLADICEPDFGGVLSTLYAGDTWLASHFGIRSRSVLHDWFPTHNREMERFAPGRLLFKCILDAADEQGITAIDRGAGNTAFKREFSNASHIYYRGRWNKPGVKFLCVAIAASAQWRLEAWRR